MGLALLELMPVDVAPYTHAPALSKGSNTCLPVRMTVWVYDVGTWVDIAAKWALSCKECRDDSSRACEAGDVGRGFHTDDDRHSVTAPALESPHRFRSAHDFIPVYDVKPVCTIRCRIGSKAGCLSQRT